MLSVGVYMIWDNGLAGFYPYYHFYSKRTNSVVGGCKPTGVFIILATRDKSKRAMIVIKVTTIPWR